MFQRYFLASLLALLLVPAITFAQTGAVGIGTTTPDPSAALDLTSTSKGLLPPRLTQAARLAMGTGSVPAPAPGLLVYQTDGTTPGYYYASSATTWVRLTDATTADTRYIQNQSSVAQSGSFRVSGSGQVGTSLMVGGAATVGGAAKVGGSVQVPAANAYTYAAAKTYTATYGASDFQPETNAMANGKLLYGTYGMGSADDFYPSAANGVLRAPLHLPQGAVITNITLVYFDSSTSDLTLTLNALTPSPTEASTLTVLGTVTTTGQPFYGSATLTPGSTVTIDNNNVYFLRVACQISNAALTVTAVRVNYTVTQAE